MSATAAYPDFSRIQDRFKARLTGRLHGICEQFVTLEQEPRYRIVDAMMREFHSLAGTAGTLGFESLSSEAAAAESLCVVMMKRGEYSRPLDLLRLQKLIGAIDRSIATISPGAAH